MLTSRDLIRIRYIIWKVRVVLARGAAQGASRADGAAGVSA